VEKYDRKCHSDSKLDMRNLDAALDSVCPPPNSIFRPSEQTEVVHESPTFVRLESPGIGGVIVRSADGDFKFDIHRNFEISQLLNHLIT
jgi:hypothetical protein